MKSTSALARAVLLLVAACGGAQVAPSISDEERLAPERLYPLQEGNVWSYSVDTGEDVALSISRVVDVFGSRVEVSSNGQTPVVYETRPEGIFRPNHEVWLLKRPIREGSTWPSTGGMTATVSSTTATVETDAGTFRGCVRVEETGGEMERTVRTTYCPQVGPVMLESTMRLDLARRPARVIAKLLGYEISPEGSP